MAAAESCPAEHHGGSQAAHVEHGAHAGHHDHAVDHVHQHHPKKEQDTGHKACLECCGVCVNVITGMPAAPSVSVHRFGLAISYSLESGVWSGQTIPIDPGIPKRIV